jgi:hypothetical protein
MLICSFKIQVCRKAKGISFSQDCGPGGAWSKNNQPQNAKFNESKQRNKITDNYMPAGLAKTSGV